MTTSQRQRIIYLDNSSTTRPLKTVTEAVCTTMREHYANPSSLHRLGMNAEKLLDECRKKTARFLNAESSEIYFTSGATEANNAIIRGIAEQYQNRGKHIITSEIEHPSVENTCKHLQELGFSVSFLPVDKWGRVKPEKFSQCLNEDTILCSIMTVNNEIGSIQPLQQISEILNEHPGPRPIFHTDAVQAIGKIDLMPSEVGVDALSLSAHKFHGPTGIGAMYLRKGLSFPPLLFGGGQEAGLRSGTENTAAAAGMSAALDWLVEENEQLRHKMMKMRRYLSEQIHYHLPAVRVNGPPADAKDDVQAPHILNVSIPGLKGEILVHALEQEGIYVSTGAACSSRHPTHNTTLKSLPISNERAESAIRFSMSPFNEPDELDTAACTLGEMVKNLKI